ncbi:hypothetical protein [Microcoleus sp. FACHB-672]|uniref:hypothetical protein n=1 Tax=Microcoleus sp. FACHB-672 TaxID=2692825 RepID=UPI0016870D3C|nr:hypothetical protein [Microcoleus sp. FACHB-672]MBD2039710.1 hypothetical protein [Microcoleus sp. FACHB-672]
MLAPVAIGVASFIGRKIALALGVRALQAAFVAGGVRGILRALAVRIASWFLAGFLISTVWGFIVTAVITIMNFDWNASDEELDEQVTAALTQLATIAGSATGTTLGWVVCGSVAGSVVTKINPIAAAKIIEEIGEEAADEIIAAWTSLLRASLGIAFRSFMSWGYKNLRRFLLKPALSAFSRTVFGADKFAQWGAKDGPAVTIANSIENAFENITPKFLQAFLESAWEEFWDSCAEVGYLTSSLLDNFAQQQANAQQTNVLGIERTVEILPDREAPTQRIILSGPDLALRPAIVQTLATHQLISQQTIGNFVGMPADESYQKAPDDLILSIKFYSVSEPPINRISGKLIEVNIKIPGIKRSAIDWAQIKTAAGGSNGYLYGPKRMNFKLSNGGNTMIYASTHQEAEQRGRALLSLSECDIIDELPGEEKEGGRRSRLNGNIKEIRQIFPYEATITYAKKITDTTKGQVRISDGARVIYLHYTFLLWPDNAPFDFTATVSGLLAGPT